LYFRTWCSIIEHNFINVLGMAAGKNDPPPPGPNKVKTRRVYS